MCVQVIYGAGVDGEFSYELWTSKNDGVAFDRAPSNRFTIF